MAITVTKAPNGLDVRGNKVSVTCNVVWTTYTASGEPLTARQLGLTTIDYLEVEPSAYGGISLVYDFAASPKLHAYVPNATPTLAATEVTGGTDLSWLGTVKIRANGTS